MSESQTDRMTRAIGIWIARLESYPGWKEWKRKHLVHTLHFDEMRQPLVDEPKDDFRFSDEVEKQHAVVIKFLALQETIRALKECEFYFRRYPFRGLPVTRHSHITNVCEMYFGRFYEFKERLKNYFDALASAVPEHHLDIGKFIKLFERSFGQELRARNHIHHHNRFEDVAIDRVLLMDSFSTVREDGGWRQEQSIAYRKFTKDWARRVVKRGEVMDGFLEAIAEATLNNCRFLSVDLSGS